MNGWIKIHRTMLEWEHFNEPSVVTVFLALLLTADKDGKTDISLGGLSSVTGMAKNTIRGALTKLVESGEITRHFSKGQRTSTTITNWKEYQGGQKLIHQDKDGISKIDTPVGQKLIHQDKDGISKIDTPVGQKLIHTISKNDTHYKNNKNKQEIVVDTHTRTHEEFIADALNDLRVEQGCMAMRATPDEYRQLVTEVTNDWIFRQLPDNEWTLAHLLAQMRIKHNTNNRNNGQRTDDKNQRAINAGAAAIAALAAQSGKPVDAPF